MPIAKRLRYEVFKRDDFTCRYCGAKAPEVRLTVDHVVPKVLGGLDHPANLVTACMPCNSGKASVNPDSPLVEAVSEDALRWSIAMELAQAKMSDDAEAREADRKQFAEWWDSWGYGEGKYRQLVPKDTAWRQTVDQLVNSGLPLVILKECIDIAMQRKTVPNDSKFRYMCGIAWRKVNELHEMAQVIAEDIP